SYESTNVEVDKETVIVSIIMEKVTACLAMIILACVALFIAKPFFQKLEEEEKSLEKSLVNVGYGVGVLFATPVLAIIATIISAIALMIPFPVVVLGLIAYGVAIYLSAIPTAYYLGNWFLKDKINNKYAYTALALVIIYLVRIIPIIGGFVTFLVVSFGTGVYFKSLLPEKKSK
ncbi:MAG: hypothetical protein IJ193_09190, partial [Bacilli bacterium]|nr:hypothetical protein [Bacilli bacterium]